MYVHIIYYHTLREVDRNKNIVILSLSLLPIITLLGEAAIAVSSALKVERRL